MKTKKIAVKGEMVRSPQYTQPPYCLSIRSESGNVGMMALEDILSQHFPREGPITITIECGLNESTKS